MARRPRIKRHGSAVLQRFNGWNRGSTYSETRGDAEVGADRREGLVDLVDILCKRHGIRYWN